MPTGLRLTKFKDVDLNDPLFDSLKSQYKEFPVWFASKAEQPVYVIDDDQADQLRGFLYVKVETEEITDIQPALPAARRLKVGTMKIIAHGTKLGERVLKKIFDHAIADQVKEIYVTVFDTHQGLIDLFKRYGFEEKGSKITDNGTELVLLRDLEDLKGDMVLDYPFVHMGGQQVFLLAIYPPYHTKLLPDSILHNENPSILEDISHTNTIHKIYIAKLALGRMKKGDIVVIYRTTDRPGQARYRSVATSICVVEETFSRRDFVNEDEFVEFAQRHSVFSEDELRAWFASGDRLFGVKMTYNAALKRRVIRDLLLDDVGIPEQPRWDLIRIDHNQFRRIAELGEVDSRLLIP